MDAPFFPVFSVKTFDFEEGEAVISFEQYSRGDDDFRLNGGLYALVPETQLNLAFQSLQDAGEAAGVPVGRNIVRYLESQKLYITALEAAIGEAMTTFRAQSNADACEKLEGVLDDKQKWGSDPHGL